MTGAATGERAVRLLDREFYAGDPAPTYRWLRDHAPAYFDEVGGVWGVSRHADVLAVERRADVFSNERRGSRPNTPSDDSMINRDDPRHRVQRRFVSTWFTPKAIASKEAHVRSITRSLLDAVAGRGSCDVVAELAAPLPMILIAEMLGVAHDDRDRLQHWSDVMIGGADGPAYVTDEVVGAHLEFVEYILGVMESRRHTPGDDLVSVLVHEEIDGERLDDSSLCSEALLLLVGGNETTRNVISGAFEMLALHPEQRELLVEHPERITAAVEECLRWVSPILNMNRTATRDVELHGETIREGDQVLVMYASANRDERVFERPDEFDVTRDPNPHVAFGFGTHFCLGAQLARLEARVMLEEALPRLRGLRLAAEGPVARTRSSFIRGIPRLPVQFEAAR